MKNSIRFTTVILMIVVVSLAFGGDSAQARGYSVAEDKAAEIHKIASSDVIYTAEEPKALYYQNIAIIELLREIKELLSSQNELIIETQQIEQNQLEFQISRSES